MSTTTYYTSRTAARTAAKAAGVKFKDQGADAATGKRWSTIAMSATAPTLSNAISPKVRTSSNVKRGSGIKPRAVTLITKMLAKGKSRQDVLAKLVNDLGLTPPGASTYYANTKNGAPGWTVD